MESVFGTLVADGEPVTADFPFWIASMTKALTTVLTQVLPFFDERIVEVAQAFEAAVYAEFASSPASDLTPDADRPWASNTERTLQARFAGV